MTDPFPHYEVDIQVTQTYRLKIPAYSREDAYDAAHDLLPHEVTSNGTLIAQTTSDPQLP